MKHGIRPLESLHSSASGWRDWQGGGATVRRSRREFCGRGGESHARRARRYMEQRDETKAREDRAEKEAQRITWKGVRAGRECKQAARKARRESGVAEAPSSPAAVLLGDAAAVRREEPAGAAGVGDAARSGALDALVGRSRHDGAAARGGKRGWVSSGCPGARERRADATHSSPCRSTMPSYRPKTQPPQLASSLSVSTHS